MTGVPITVWFHTPVAGIDPDDGAEVVSNRHRVVADYVSQTKDYTSFYDADDDEVAYWETADVDRIIWPSEAEVEYAGDDDPESLESDAADENGLDAHHRMEPDGGAVDDPDTTALRDGSPPGNGARWTRQEEWRLVEGFRGGLPVSELAQRHGRSIGAIEQRLSALGVRAGSRSGSQTRRGVPVLPSGSANGRRRSGSGAGTGVRSFGPEPAIGERCSACDAWVAMGAAHDCR